MQLLKPPSANTLRQIHQWSKRDSGLPLRLRLMALATFLKYNPVLGGATVVSTPVITWAATIQALTGIQYSASLYFSIQNTGGWEIQVPVQVRFSLASADPIVNVYPTSDGAANYDSQPMFSFSVARSNSNTRQASIRIPTGQYLIQVQFSGPNSASVAVLTAQVMTAINQV